MEETNQKWRDLIKKEWIRRQAIRDQQHTDIDFPLNQQTYNEEEILGMVEVMLDGRLSMGKKVDKFEKEFAKKVGSKFSVFCNSGSSANLLAVAAACEKVRLASNGYLKPGDEVIVPSLCWSTSIYPFIQFGLKPVMVDVNPFSLNTTLENIKNAITPKTKCILIVHVMGNCGCDEGMEKIVELAKKKNLIIIEDTCESLLSKWNDKVYGTFGDFGTYSFYFSHHLCTGEGGMVVCQNQRDYDLLRSIRSHGWTRTHSKNFREEEEKDYKNVDNRFLFSHLGYNLRPMEVQGAMGLVQLKKIDEMNSNRIKSFYMIIDKIKKHPKYNNQFDFIQNIDKKNNQPVWFGFPCLFKEKFKGKKEQFLKYLTKNKVENRPILTGNFCRQPVLKKTTDIKQINNPKEFTGADRVHFYGFYVGTNSAFLDENYITKLVNIIMDFF